MSSRPGAVIFACLGIAVGLAGFQAAQAPALLAPAWAGCGDIGGSAVCDGDVSHTEVGRRLIFPRGPAGERIGDFVARPEGSLPQVLPKGTGSLEPGPRPLNRADGLTDPRRGENFGAFEFRSPPPSGLNSTGPLR